MTSKPKKPRTKMAPTPATRSYRPFTRLDEHGSATTEDFDVEGMGIAAKE
jgi:hypothetical protein